MKESHEKDFIISKFNALSNEEKITFFNALIDELSRLNPNKASGSQEISIPIGIFENDELSTLEAIVK